MANSFDEFFPELWSARIQKLREKMLVSAAVCNFEEQQGLTFGDRVHRPTAPDFVVNTYSRGVNVTLQDVTSSDEYLDIDRSKEVSFYIDKLDKKQSKYDVEMEAVKRATYAIKNEMDAYRLKETINATYDADAEQTGGSSGTPATLTPSNMVQFAENAKAILATANVEDDRPWYWIVTPKIAAVISQTFIGSGFNLADTVLKNGYKGDAFGLKIYQSTNVLHTQTLTGSTIVNGNTYTVAGVTFTFATTATNAGDVDLGSSDTDAMANLVLALNGTGTPGATTYIDVSAADRILLKNANVSATSALGVATISTSGEVVSSKNGAPLTLGTQMSHNEMGRMGTVDMVVQMYPEMQKNKDPLKSGYNYLIIDLYGVKTFTEGKDRMLDAKVAV